MKDGGGGDLTTRTVKGLMWSGTNQLASQVFQMATKIILARLLAPEYFGLVGMALIFTNFIQLVNELGLGAAIVQKKEIEERHLSTAFYASIGISLVMFILGVALSPLIASFFKQDQVQPIVAWLSFGFFLGSFSTIHRTILQRRLDFRHIAMVDIAGVLVTGVLSVSLALAGAGVWSLVVGSLAGTVVRSIAMWVVNDWRPKWLFDRKAFRELFDFGKHVLGSRLLNYADTNTDYLVVGRLLNPTDLGIYTMAYNLAVFPLTQVSQTISKVTFPAFSAIQDETAKLRRSYLQAVRYTSLVTFPALVGMALVAPYFVTVILGEKWLGMIAPLQWLCGYGILASVSHHTGSVLLSRGRADIQFRFNLVTVIAYPAAIIVGVNFGITGVAAATTLMGFFVFLMVQIVTSRQIDLKARDFMAALAPAILCTTVMACAVIIFRGICEIASLSDLVALVGSVTVGLITYPLAIRLRDRIVISELKEILKKGFRRDKSK